VPRQDVSIHDAPLSKRELQDAALVAARAFHTDPFFEYLSPMAVARARGLALYFASLLRHLGPTARILTGRRDGAVIGIGAWIPPEGYPFTASLQLAQTLGALRALYRVPPSIVRGLRYLTAIETAHPKEPLWYLQLLACDAQHQGTGVGTALVEGVLAECDRDGIASYLETQKEANLAYYGRFGYEVAATLNPVRDGPPLWTLRREPRQR